MRLRASCALLGLLFLTVLDLSECQQTVVTPDKGSIVTLSTELPSCTVCTVSGENDTDTTCHSSLSLVPEEEVKLLFNCPQPAEQAFTVAITRTIECTEDACSPTTGDAQPSILTNFTRTFTWEFKAPEKAFLSLNILGKGLMETSQPCPDGFQYSVTTSKTNSKGSNQYCQGGSETRLDLRNEAVVSLQVKPKAQVEAVLFQTSVLKGRKMDITVDANTNVVVSRDPKEPECDVCTADGSTSNCSPTNKTLTKNEKLEFSCPKPEDVYSVTIKKKIACTESTCSPAAGEVDPNLFKDFKRSLMWDITVPERTVLTLGFPGGLKEMSGAENCQNGFQYSVSTTKRGKIKTNSYCKGGAVSQLDLDGATTVTVEVPKGGELDSAFTAKAAKRGSRTVSVTTDPGTWIVIRRVADEPDCSVCKGEVPTQKCESQELYLNDLSLNLEFTCPQPQDVFSVQINREIDCPCSDTIVEAKSSLFSGFNRTFTWYMKVDATHAFQLDIPEPGMRQIPNEETCPDEHTYTLATYLRTGPTTIGTFCKGGTVTTFLTRYRGHMSLQVPGNMTLDPVGFKLNVGPDTNLMAIVKVDLPRGVSDTDFFSANYPGNFSDEEQMRWDFTVPDMHNYTVHFRDHRVPECLKNEVVVEYQKKGKKTKLTLTDPQPEQQQGDFSMMLKNCETNTTQQGLALSYRVSMTRSGHPVLCMVDLTKHQGVSMQIEKVGSDPYCEMSMDSKVVEKINVAAGTKASLSFLDCPNEDVRLTASQLIGCQDAACSLLRVPKLASCLPMPLHNFTWHINIPQDRTVDLESPTGSLRQSLPGQECNQSVSLHVVEGDGSSLGDFCFNGVIQKVQVHDNVSVTARAWDFGKTRGPFLNVTLSQEIPENIIYRVSPKVSSLTRLATPNWPRGMSPSSTVVWIVTLPSRYQAHLRFVNVSQPKCKDRHTGISVKMLGQQEEILSRREDEAAVDKLTVPQSFYLNMSNCVTEGGDFGSLTEIVLEKNSNLLAIILGIAGAILLALIVLAVVCIITKKKKQDRMNKESSIYIGKGNIFRPGDRHFTKTRSDNESHVYDSIDETMVYGHLLPNDSSYADSMSDHYNGMQVDSYKTFTGPTDPALPVINEPDHEPEMDKIFLDPSESFIPSRPRTPIQRQESLGFQDSRMVDNELYTFKSTGDMNTIRLSGVDLDPQPPVIENSL